MLSDNYGFVHLPSLIVYVYPHSPFPTVRSALLESWIGNHAPLMELLELGPEDQAIDAYMRATVVSHERRHFMDLLLTPYGNSLFRLSCAYALSTSGLLIGLTRGDIDAKVVTLPIDESTGADTQLIDLVRTRREQFEIALRVGSVTMESSASFTQELGAMQTYGPETIYTHMKWLIALLNGTSEQGQNVGRVHSNLHRALRQGQHGLDVMALREVAPTLQRLFMIALTDEHPDRALVSILSRVSKEGFKIDKLSLVGEALDKMENPMSQAFAHADDRNAQFLNYLQSMSTLHLFGSDLREMVLEVVDDFCNQARRVRSQYRDDPFAFTDPIRFDGMDEGLVEPFMYKSTSSSLITDDESWRQSLDDPLTVVEEIEGDRSGYRLTSVPIKHSVGQPMSMRWKDFAVAFGGSIALGNGANWSDPLEGEWLKGMERVFGVTFQRSFKQQGRDGTDRIGLARRLNPSGGPLHGAHSNCPWDVDRMALEPLSCSVVDVTENNLQ